MLADVRLMRKFGHRLPREEVRASTPVRGNLAVFTRSDLWRNCLVPVAGLMGPDLITYLLPPLDQVRIRRWLNRDLVLVGLAPISRRRSDEHELQAWWVQLVSDPVPLQTDQPTSDA